MKLKYNETFSKVLNHGSNILMGLIVAISFYKYGITLGNISALLATLGVIFLAYGSNWSFPFNMAQNLVFFIVTWQTGIYGDSIMALYYLGSQLIIGIPYFRKNRSKDGKLKVVKTVNWPYLITGILVTFFVLGGISWYLGGNYIFMDALNNSTAFVAQYTQMRGMTVSNYLWLFTNATSLYVYIGMAEWGIVAQTLAQTVSTVRSIYNWHFLPSVDDKENGQFQEHKV